MAKEVRVKHHSPEVDWYYWTFRYNYYGSPVQYDTGPANWGLYTPSGYAHPELSCLLLYCPAPDGGSCVVGAVCKNEGCMNLREGRISTKMQVTEPRQTGMVSSTQNCAMIGTSVVSEDAEAGTYTLSGGPVIPLTHVRSGVYWTAFKDEDDENFYVVPYQELNQYFYKIRITWFDATDEGEDKTGITEELWCSEQPGTPSGVQKWVLNQNFGVDGVKYVDRLTDDPDGNLCAIGASAGTAKYWGSRTWHRYYDDTYIYGFRRGET